MSMKPTTRSQRILLAAIAGAFFLSLGQPARGPFAQGFSSGSDGSDGALSVAANQGTILFDPKDSARWGRVLDPDGDGVYHFTTVTVGVNTTLRLRGDKVSVPMHWLATGNIVVAGNLDLSGENASSTSDPYLRRQIGLPGAGGFSGGAGGRDDVTPKVPASPGEGPGGGAVGMQCVTGPPLLPCGKGAAYVGNRYVVPLLGGSGGQGAYWTSFYVSGGAGGGAILLASSTSVSVTGTIWAFGGNGGPGGGGGGGTIRVVAPTVTGNGTFDVRGGSASPYTFSAGAPGWVRLEGFTVSTTFVFTAGVQTVTRGAPIDSSTLVPSGVVRVTAIDGVAIPVYPSGSFTLPDVTINTANSVNIDIEGAGIPPGTTVTLVIIPDTPTDLTTYMLPPVQAVLQGTLQKTTATVPFTFPYGFSKGYVQATWTQ